MNTWVSFQSAEQPLLGQFSVSGNTLVLSFSWMRETYSYVLDKTEYGYSQRTPLGEGTILRLL
ncbi:hypothetical protein [Pseudomonas aeruginosa]|uniref:hypothetical protein n=1 Tax=Pseudomonas aeruginosa TaxID=287 RepID=UPI003992F1F2